MVSYGRHERLLTAVADQLSLVIGGFIAQDKLCESEMRYRSLAESDLVGVHVNEKLST